MKNIILISILCSIFITGCVVDSENKVSHNGTATPDVAKLVGTWRGTTLLGDPIDNSYGYTDLVISDPSGNKISGLLKQGGTTHSNLMIEITNVGSLKICSYTSDGGETWRFLKYSLTGSDDILNLYFPEIDKVVDDINGSVVSGVAYEYDSGSYLISLSASSSALRSYISGNSDIFPANPVSTFEKQ